MKRFIHHRSSVICLMLSVICLMLFITTTGISAASEPVVAGRTLAVLNTDCTIACVQGPFGGGDGAESGPAVLTCGADTFDMTFIFQSPQLTLYSEAYQMVIDFALIRETFRQLAAGGIQLQPVSE